MKRIVFALFIVFIFSITVSAAGESTCYLRGLPSEEGAVVIDGDVGYVAASLIERAYPLDIKMEDDTVRAATASEMFRFLLREKGEEKNTSFYSEDPSALIVDGKLYLPIRRIAETLGDKVDWDGDNRTIIVQCPKGESFNYYNKSFGFSLNGDSDVLNRVAFTYEDEGSIAVSIDGEDAGDIFVSTAPTLRTHDGFLLDYRKGTYYEYRRNEDLDRPLSKELTDLLMTFKRQ